MQVFFNVLPKEGIKQINNNLGHQFINASQNIAETDIQLKFSSYHIFQ